RGLTQAEAAASPSAARQSAASRRTACMDEGRETACRSERESMRRTIEGWVGEARWNRTRREKMMTHGGPVEAGLTHAVHSPDARAARLHPARDGDRRDDDRPADRHRAPSCSGGSRPRVGSCGDDRPGGGVLARTPRRPIAAGARVGRAGYGNRYGRGARGRYPALETYAGRQLRDRFGGEPGFGCVRSARTRLWGVQSQPLRPPGTDG